MNIISRFICIACMLAVWSSYSYADTVILKNKKVIEGKITRQDDKEIEILDPVTYKPVVIKKTDVQEIKIVEVIKESPSADILRMLQPRLGTLQGIAAPIGDVADALGVGYYGSVFSDVLVPVPFPEKIPMSLRGGLGLGFGYLASDDGKASITMLTVRAHGELSYIMKDLGLRPFLHLGFGFAMPMLKKDTDDGTIEDSSFDGSLAVGAGLGYTLPVLPQLELILNVGYLIAFETTNGQFLTVGIGAAYTFNTPGGEANAEQK